MGAFLVGMEDGLFPGTRAMGDPEEMEEIGYQDYFYGEGVSLIEWANLIEEILPKHYRRITIEKDLEKGFDYRRIIFDGETGNTCEGGL